MLIARINFSDQFSPAKKYQNNRLSGKLEDGRFFDVRTRRSKIENLRSSNPKNEDSLFFEEPGLLRKTSPSSKNPLLRRTPFFEEPLFFEELPFFEEPLFFEEPPPLFFEEPSSSKNFPSSRKPLFFEEPPVFEKIYPSKNLSSSENHPSSKNFSSSKNPSLLRRTSFLRRTPLFFEELPLLLRSRRSKTTLFSILGGEDRRTPYR